jgi:hypothetical protein
MLTHIYNPRTLEAEAGVREFEIWLHSKTLSHKKKKKPQKKVLRHFLWDNDVTNSPVNVLKVIASLYYLTRVENKLNSL